MKIIKFQQRLSKHILATQAGYSLLSSVFCITLFALFAAFSLSKYAHVKSQADALVQTANQKLKPEDLPLKALQANGLSPQQLKQYVIEENGQLFLKIPLPETLQTSLKKTGSNH